MATKLHPYLYRFIQTMGELLFVVLVAGCGGVKGESTDSGSGQTIGGTLTGLDSGASLRLQLNTIEDLVLVNNGDFQFDGTLTSGMIYTVTVKTQPFDQICTVKNGNGVAKKQAVITVEVHCSGVPGIISKLPDTGVEVNQCYGAGGSELIGCTSVNAVALNPAQDGMTGHDVFSPDDINGKLGFNYTKIAADGSELAPDAPAWFCVKDNITGLIWEVKTTDGGLRDVNKTYNNYTSTTENQHGYWDGTGWVMVAPTQAQINSPNNAAAYVAAVNSNGLCGKKDWRLPTENELQGLVDYGMDHTVGKPAIDEKFFPHTAGWMYWTSSALMGEVGSAWGVHFQYGYVFHDLRLSLFHVRLVR